MCIIQFNDVGSIRSICQSRDRRWSRGWPDVVERRYDCPPDRIFFFNDQQYFSEHIGFIDLGGAIDLDHIDQEIS